MSRAVEYYRQSEVTVVDDSQQTKTHLSLELVDCDLQNAAWLYKNNQTDKTVKALESHHFHF